MKLKAFNPENCISARTEVPCINMNIKAGLFSINKAAVDQLQLHESGQVVFHQDEEEPGDWYIESVKKTRKNTSSSTILPWQSKLPPA